MYVIQIYKVNQKQILKSSYTLLTDLSQCKRFTYDKVLLKDMLTVELYSIYCIHAQCKTYCIYIIYV